MYVTGIQWRAVPTVSVVQLNILELKQKSDNEESKTSMTAYTHNNNIGFNVLNSLNISHSTAGEQLSLRHNRRCTGLSLEFQTIVC